MEHLILLGGEQYLPFARSRIKALHATGQPYARQSFEIDGVSITVRIEPEHDYIRIEGGGASLEMDSGVFTPLRSPADGYEAIERSESTASGTYHASFVATDTSLEWKIKPGGGGGQITGRTTSSGPRFRGQLPYHGRAFSPGTVVDATLTPPGWKANPADNALVNKRTVALACPASMFTGRCRMYVQALYGQWLYSGPALTRAGALRELATPNYVPTLGAGTQPSLVLDAYRPPGDSTDYGDVALTTNSGVYLDPATGKHWLINPDNTISGITTYPLISSQAGETLRKFLRNTGAVAGALNATDKEHLEAFILSACKPDVRAVQHTAANAWPTNTWSMGYGWHWNWTGLTADLVSTEEFSQGTFGGHAYSAMRSTHHRIQVAFAAPVAPATQPTWTCTYTVVSGPSDWAVDRAIWCIAETSWTDATLIKSTPRYTTLFACDATFYAFYLRDELQLCRVSVTLESAASTAWTSSTDYTQADGVTEGLRGGSGAWRSQSAYKSATFTVGGSVIAGLTSNKSATGNSTAVSEKRKYTQNGGSIVVYSTSGSIESGYPPYELLYFPSGTTLEYDAPLFLEYSYTTSSVADTWNSAAIVIVPFYDAEAAFLYGTETLTSDSTGIVVQTRRSAYFGRENRYMPPDAAWSPWVPRYTAAAYWSGGVVATTNPPDTSETTTESDVSVLVCSAGAVPATFDALVSIWDQNSETVASTYATLSSVGGVVASLNAATVGMSAAIDYNASPGFVGWV